jgi:DNA-3-methyladenine glycosylase
VQSFFERPPDDVAHDLVGSLLILRRRHLELRAKIVETEAYGGADDAASHAFTGLTRRNAVMFGPPGHLYVYRIYGLHWCINVVTGSEGCASAVLLRAAELMARPSVNTDDLGDGVLLRGPGNLTRGLGVTGDDNGRDCVASSERSFSFHEPLVHDTSQLVRQSKRIRISQEKERQSRYFLDGHRAVSGSRSSTRS